MKKGRITSGFIVLTLVVAITNFIQRLNFFVSDLSYYWADGTVATSVVLWPSSASTSNRAKEGEIKVGVDARYNLTSRTPGVDGWYSAEITSNCLHNKWIYFIGDSNSLKISEAWRSQALLEQNFSGTTYVASNKEYQRFKAGEIKWWQDSDVFFKYRGSSNQQHFRFSFRFQQQSNFDDVRRKIGVHLSEPNRVFIKDGTTEWYPDHLRKEENTNYGQHPDILWLSLGQWIANNNNNNNNNSGNNSSLCTLIEDTFKMFTDHPASVKIWMNIPRVWKKEKVEVARTFHECEKDLTFQPNMYYFDLYNYTSYYENIFWGDGYHLRVEYQKVIMLNALDVICEI
jgi:hypothetical protein